MPKTKLEQVFELFDKGFTTTSPEVKAIVKKSKSRSAYISRWRKAKREQAATVLPRGETVRVANETPAKPTPPPGKASPVDPFHETDCDGEDEDEGEHKEGGGEEKSDQEPHNGEGKVSRVRDQTIPDSKQAPVVIAGEGLIITARISVKTMALYEIAKTAQKDLNPDGVELSLGDFIDTCVEDTYRGRGLDLGLIKTRG